MNKVERELKKLVKNNVSDILNGIENEFTHNGKNVYVTPFGKSSFHIDLDNDMYFMRKGNIVKVVV